MAGQGARKAKDGFTARAFLNALALAFTLLEVVVVVAVLGILATLLVPAVQPVRERVEQVVCMGNLRTLHVAFGSYVDDHEQWPQCPTNLDRAAADQFWIGSLQEYGVKPEAWLCPTLMRSIHDGPMKGGEVPHIHYIPTQFDSRPMTPRRWPAMPWLIEIGNMHHNGSLLIRTDGVIKTMNDIFREAGVDASGTGTTIQKLK